MPPLENARYQGQQELQALERAAHPAAMQDRHTSGTPRDMPLLQQHLLPEQPTTRQIQPPQNQHAIQPQGTPWTVANAALPAYPPLFTPQLPFKSTGAQLPQSTAWRGRPFMHIGMKDCNLSDICLHQVLT
eukprot:355645-Chlamydomonas_euryale.AAC.37